MKILNSAFAILILLAGCKNQPDKNKKQDVYVDKSHKEVVQKEKIYNTKCAILYLPDSIQLATLEKEKSQEELNSIEYDKTMAMEFLRDKGISIFIEDNKQYKFKKSNGEVVIIDKSSYQNWGIILFKPDKEPKVVFLSEIEEEYASYFN